MAVKSKSVKSKTMTKGARVGRILVNLLLGVVVLVFVIAISFILLQISGKNSLYSMADNGKMITTGRRVISGLREFITDTMTIY